LANDHNAKSEEDGPHRWPLIGGPLLEALDPTVERMGKDETAEIGYIYRIEIAFALLIWDGK
jgi:hypothetical protein